MSLLHATILTIFPEMFPGSLQYSLAGQALQKNIWSYEVINIRDFGLTKHKNVDDEPYGGGSGLIMRADVLGAALDHALLANPGSRIFYPSPRGQVLTQKFAREIIKAEIIETEILASAISDKAINNNIIILCGRFEGIDERIIEEYNITEISIGDYILSGGEVAALTILDCLIRLLPNVLVNNATLQSESFEEQGEFAGLLECPLYTRPAKWRERQVPDILLSGHHKMIQNWKIQQSVAITKQRRPDLLPIFSPDI